MVEGGSEKETEARKYERKDYLLKKAIQICELISFL